MERCVSGENRGADHAGVAADDAQRAEAALVYVAARASKRFRQRIAERMPIEALPASGLRNVQVQRMHAYHAAMIRPIRGE